MSYDFKIEDKTRIIDRFGNEFFIKVRDLLETLQLKWGVYDLQMVNSFSVNLIFKGISDAHGPVVIKFSTNHEEFISEANALKYFEGRNICRLIDADFDNKVLLEESINPGDELVLEKQIERRLDVFCDLFQQLHLDNSKQIKSLSDTNREYCYKSYKDWIFRITDYMKQQKNWKEVSLHMIRAKELYKELSQEYAAEFLLHGDFHYYNILKDKKGYKIIDPKGVRGNPIFDIPRYVLNEFWDEEDKTKVDDTIEIIFYTLSQKLNISRDILSKLLYIEGAMAISWCVESGADINEKANYLDTLEKLYMYMLKYR